MLRQVCLLAGLVAIGAAGCLDVLEERKAPDLVLEEIASWRVAPEMSAITGGVIGADTSVMIWTVGGQLGTVRPPSAGVQSWQSPSVSTGFRAPDRSIRLIDAAGRLFRLNGDEGWLGEDVRCPVLAGASTVLPILDGLLLVVSPAETGRIQQLAVVAMKSEGCQMGEPIDIVCPHPPGLTEGGASGTLISCSDPLQPLMSLDVRAEQMDVLSIPESVPGDMPGSQSTDASWYGLPLLRLDRGFLRVVADLRSHTRRLEVFDRRGRHESTTLIVEPLGFFASDPEGRLLLGMRGVQEQHLVLFRWSWESAGQ